MDELRIKVELLCWGIRPNRSSNEAFRHQNPQGDKRTGNAGLHLLLADGKVVINVPVDNRSARRSPYEIEKADHGWQLLKNGRLQCECDVVPAPRWYSKDTTDGVPLSSVLVQEGRSTLIASVNNACDYAPDVRCRFCALGPYAGVMRKDAIQIREAAAVALKENPAYHLHLTGGNVLPSGRPPSAKGDLGMLQYLSAVRAVRAVSGVPISIEASPPEDNEHLKILVDAGVDAFSINLEVWDERLRRMYCPAKSIISRRRYFDTWEYALGLLGKNMVCSVLIGGLESRESTVIGAAEMTKVGVIPTAIPLRRNDGSWLEHFAPPLPDDMEWISRRVGELLYKSGLKPWTQPGCTACGACSAEQDYQKLSGETTRSSRISLDAS